MDIPIFLSCPTKLNPDQDAARAVILHYLQRYKLESRALGRSDYPTELPLREVLAIAKHCAGGIILGFEQYRSVEGINRPGTPEAMAQRITIPFPTPWNNLEAGMLFGLGLPILIFKEEGISGGVFDAGATDVFIHPMPTNGHNDGLEDVFLKWQSVVRRHYYGS
jgi:hypothetical protein